MPIRTIQSPGVQINEIDLSLRTVTPVGTTILIPGFAAQGPTDEAFEVTSLPEFEQVYGLPTNAAERYFYHTVKAAFQSDATVLTTRLPYGSANGDGFSSDYSALFYPVIALNTGSAATIVAAVTATGNSYLSGVSGLANDSLTATGNYIYIGAPTLISLTNDQYNVLSQEQFEWSNQLSASNIFSTNSATWGKAGFIIVNKAKATINDKYEGYYIGITDPSWLNPATDFNCILDVKTINQNSSNLTLSLPTNRKNFVLSSAYNGTGSQNGSISEVMENLPKFNVTTRAFSDTMMVGVFKLRQSVFAPDPIKLDYVLSEAYVGSLFEDRAVQSETGGAPRSFYLGTQSSDSPNIEIHVNKYLRQINGLNSAGNTKNFIKIFNSTSTDLNTMHGVVTAFMDESDSLYALGNYQAAYSTNKTIGSIPGKLNRIFEQLDNVEMTPIDLVCEAGLGTIFAAIKTAGLTATDMYDDTVAINLGSTTTPDGFYSLTEAGIESPYTDIRDNYLAVYNEFRTFAENKRKDCMIINDPLKHIFVQGDNNKTLNNKANTFTQHIYWPLRHLYGSVNTSYAATYANWARVYDSNSDRQIWAPFSGFIAATMANNDRTYAPWYAPAGFERGRFSGVNDLAVIPAQKNRDQLYKINMNPITQYPGQGFVIFGQKTMYRVPSAFDRINVRRMFLWAERATRDTVKFFLFAPNTVITRTRVVNNLTPIFEFIKNTEGLYDYQLVCDQRNNTNDRIDNNELWVDIYIQPVRAAEFIMVNFYATKTGVNFNELIRGA